MPVVMYCPNLQCRAIVQVPEKARGQKVRCGQCGTAFLVPPKPGKPPAPKPADLPA